MSYDCKNFFTEIGKWFFPCLKKENKVMEQKHTEPVPSGRPKITYDLMIADRKLEVKILEKRYDIS
ncbi:hypothetical protein [Candidatus Williamhamiltonella defendens]|uniref:hypothetical protein n=1 Tax=Candidatus Williamhamiltonella defendens TaxID=138072 RepID=UPI00130EC367|nr:hypothetical protein [Candidatus Hamiltonella defensa]